jgi:hypothetical protein
MGLTPHWFGRLPGLLRLPTLLFRFRAHIVQSTHFFMNLYAALPRGRSARFPGACAAIASTRNPIRGKKAAGWPDALLTNSQAAKLRGRGTAGARTSPTF